MTPSPRTRYDFGCNDVHSRVIDCASRVRCSQGIFRFPFCHCRSFERGNLQLLVTRQGGPGVNAQNVVGTRFNAAIASGTPGGFLSTFCPPKKRCPPRRVALRGKDGSNKLLERRCCLGERSRPEEYGNPAQCPLDSIKNNTETLFLAKPIHRLSIMQQFLKMRGILEGADEG
jgi:hypothetical protein